MRVHAYERAFLALSGLLLVACLGALLYATTERDIHLPGKVATVDPAQLTTTPPFDHPGVRQTGPASYEVILVGHAWYFAPAEIHVPVGAEVTFIGTSGDVIHGLDVPGTRVNAMLVPGQVTRFVYRFQNRGEFLLICHEYCGAGHQTMAGKVVVQ